MHETIHDGLLSNIASGIVADRIVIYTTKAFVRLLVPGSSPTPTTKVKYIIRRSTHTARTTMYAEEVDPY